MCRQLTKGRSDDRWRCSSDNLADQKLSLEGGAVVSLPLSSAVDFLAAVNAVAFLAVVNAGAFLAVIGRGAYRSVSGCNHVEGLLFIGYLRSKRGRLI